MAERKRYINVGIPILRSEMRVLGTPEDLHSKTIKLDLTRKLRGKGLNVKFRIFNKDGSLVAVPNKMELTLSYIRRVMRKRTSYVEDSFNARCKDVATVVKPFLITRKKVSRAVRKNLRNTAREFTIEYLKEREYLDFCKELLDGSFQKALLPKLKKVYPLSFCDIRAFETKEVEQIDLEKVSMDKEEVLEEVEETEEAGEELNEPNKDGAEDEVKEIEKESDDEKEGEKEE